MKPAYKYTTAAESTSPGYLRRKFAKLRAEQRNAAEAQKAAEQEAQQKVRKIRKGA